MYCRECGYQNADGAKFCRNCGTPIEEAPVIREADVKYNQGPQQPGYGYPDQDTVYVRDYYAEDYNPDQAVLDKSGRVISSEVSNFAVKNTGSAVFLIGTILFSLSVIFKIVSAFIDTASVETAIDLLGGGIPTSLVMPYTIAITIISNIPAILIALALWITFASAKSAHGEPMGTGGLTFLKAMSIFRIIIAALVMAIIVLAAVIVIALSSSMLYILTVELGITVAEAESIKIIVWGAVAGVIIGEVLMIIYYAKSIAFINGARLAISEGNLTGKKPVFVPVFSFIIAAVDLAQAAYSFFSFSGMMTTVSALLTALVYIMFGIAAISYRRKSFRISQ